MTRREAERLVRQQQVLQSLGFTHEEAEQLRRISMTLRRWHELECGDGNGCIERAGDNSDGAPYWQNSHNGKSYRIPDRETGAKKRLATILARRNGDQVRHTCCVHCGLDIEGIAPFTEWRDRGNNSTCNDGAHEHAPAENDKEHLPLSAYVQTDPRGAALYILRPGDVPEGQPADAYYSRGICVY